LNLFYSTGGTIPVSPTPTAVAVSVLTPTTQETRFPEMEENQNIGNVDQNNAKEADSSCGLPVNVNVSRATAEALTYFITYYLAHFYFNFMYLLSQKGTRLIRKISIRNFMCIDKEDLDVGELISFTGTGKSAHVIAVLLGLGYDFLVDLSPDSATLCGWPLRGNPL